MKKKIIITLLLIVPFISIFLVVIFRGVLSPNNEEIIRDLKNIKCYETKVEYIVKNSKGEEREDTVQYYSKDEGVRVEFDDNKIIAVNKKVKKSLMFFFISIYLLIVSFVIYYKK